MSGLLPPPRSSRFLLPFLLLPIAGCAGQDAAVDDPPVLIVNMSVDQLRPDLIERYDALFTGGLRRLVDEGFHHPDATHDHAATETAVGHATLTTGVHPTRSGIISNSWREQREDGSWRSVYAVEDTLAPILGHPSYPGRSPENLLVGGLPDWLVAHSPGSRVASVAGKDRSAATMGGRVRGGEVYWILPEEGAFVTSSWYREAYPEWVERFNRERMPVLYGDTIWESTIPPEALALTRPDTADWEGDGVNSWFPHRASVEATGFDEERIRYNRWRGRTPFPDAAVLEFAAEAVRSLELGQRGVVDYLAVGLSQTDYVGHGYGPWSREQLDNLLRLDRALGEFFSFLDQTVGEGRWILGLSADHGVLDVPEAVTADGGASRRLTAEEQREFRSVAEAAAAAGGDDPVEVARRVAEAVRALPYVGGAFPLADLESIPPGDTIVDLHRNSFSLTRVASPLYEFGVEMYLPEHFLFAGRPQGTTHASPWYYDRHVPLSFLGAGVVAGRSDERAATVDMAPTLAGLAGIPVPDGLDGRARDLPRGGGR